MSTDVPNDTTKRKRPCSTKAASGSTAKAAAVAVQDGPAAARPAAPAFAGAAGQRPGSGAAAAASVDAEAVATIALLRKLTDTCIVGVSLGKDSLAVLDLVMTHRPAFRAVHTYFLYLVAGLEFQERTLRYLQARYGIHVQRLPHFCLSPMLRRGNYRPQDAVGRRAPALPPAEAEDALRGRFDCRWLVTGYKRVDSLERNAMLSRTGPVDVRRGRCHPLLTWTHGHVYDYLRRRRIPLPPDYRALKESFGHLSGPELFWLRENYPDDYARVIAAFPYAEALTFRYAMNTGRRN